MTGLHIKYPKSAFAQATAAPGIRLKAMCLMEAIDAEIDPADALAVAKDWYAWLIEDAPVKDVAAGQEPVLISSPAEETEKINGADDTPAGSAPAAPDSQPLYPGDRGVPESEATGLRPHKEQPASRARRPGSRASHILNALAEAGHKGLTAGDLAESFGDATDHAVQTQLVRFCRNGLVVRRRAAGQRVRLYLKEFAPGESVTAAENVTQDEGAFGAKVTEVRRQVTEAVKPLAAALASAAGEIHEAAISALQPVRPSASQVDRILAFLGARSISGATRKEIAAGAFIENENSCNTILLKLRSQAAVQRIADRWYLTEHVVDIGTDPVEAPGETPRPHADPEPVPPEPEPARPRRDLSVPIATYLKQRSILGATEFEIAGAINAAPADARAALHAMAIAKTVKAAPNATGMKYFLAEHAPGLPAYVPPPPAKTVSVAPAVNNRVVTCRCKRSFRPEYPAQTECNICLDKFSTGEPIDAEAE